MVHLLLAHMAERPRPRTTILDRVENSIRILSRRLLVCVHCFVLCCWPLQRPVFSAFTVNVANGAVIRVRDVAMSIQFFVLILLELAVLFLGISTLVGIILEYISDETLRRWLSKGGWLGYFMAATLGAVTPFCSCSTMPITVGLLRARVPFGPTMSFVLASPLLNPIILTMFLALLGWKACVVYAVVTFVMAMIVAA